MNTSKMSKMMLQSKKKIILVLLFSVLSSFAEKKNNMKFDYFRLDLVWPNSFCNQGIKPYCKEPIPQHFLVHGLLPCKGSRRYYPRRTSTLFSFSKTEVTQWNFSHNLSTVWPNLMNDMTDVQIWELEWNRNGIRTELNPKKYFSLGLEFANKYDYLYRTLLKSGVITPSQQLYQGEILHDEIAKAVGSKAMITCNQYKNTIQFFSVCICINIKGIALDCPQRFHKCGPRKTLLFPTEETVFLTRGQEDAIETSLLFQTNKFHANQTAILETLV